MNLKHGVNRTRPDGSLQSDTCTACAGSFLMEFAALSRLTNKPVYEVRLRKLFDKCSIFSFASLTIVEDCSQGYGVYLAT